VSCSVIVWKTSESVPRDSKAPNLWPLKKQDKEMTLDGHGRIVGFRFGELEIQKNQQEAMNPRLPTAHAAG
jgi:hypothetical protein